MADLAAQLLQTYQQNSETVVLKYIFEVFEKISCHIKEGGGKTFLKQIFSAVASGAWKIAAIIALRYIVGNPGKIYDLYNSHIWPVIMYLLYKRRLFASKGGDENDAIQDQLLTIGTEFNPLIPVIIESKKVQNIQYVAVYTIFLIHRGLVETAVERGKEIYNKRINTRDTTLMQDGIIVKPNKLFPSRNYLRIFSIIDSYNESSKILGIRKPRAILIDGEPRLGKTCTADALADMGYGNFDSVCSIDMTKFIGKNFTLRAIFDTTFNKLSKPKGLIIMLFDELDKYLEMNIKNTFELYVGRMRKIAEKRDELFVQPDYKAFYTNYKEKFLMELLHLIEISHIEHGIVFLFCANNFDTIFEGVDMTHFHSLKKRLLKVKFNRCDKQELINFIEYNNRKFEGSRFYCEPVRLAEILAQIRDDLTIPYGELTDNLTLAENNIEKFVAMLNEWEYVPPPAVQDSDEEINFDFTCVKVSDKFTFPTERQVLPASIHPHHKDYYMTPPNGLVLATGNNYLATDYVINKNMTVQAKRCLHSSTKCKVGAICTKCNEAYTCGCTLRYLEWSESPDGNGYWCNKCMPSAWNYYPTANDMNEMNDESRGFFAEKSAVDQPCIRGHWKMGFPGCYVVVKCMKCIRKTCSCSRKFLGWKKYDEGDGYVCDLCCSSAVCELRSQTPHSNAPTSSITS